MRRRRKMIIYNLFPLLAGTFSQWERHLFRAAQMGFNWVFVNPIQRPGASGSLYSIADYYDFNPLLIDKNSRKGPREQVREMIQTAEKMGLHMMVDLVINHCAADSNLLRLHPEWFVWHGKGRVAHPYCYEGSKKVIWRDLAKFDHKHTKDPEGLYQFLFEVVQFLMDLGFKGLRCDAAYQVPGKLWKRLIRETKKRHRGVLFMAETLGCPPDQTRKTAGAGFDYIFNSSKWWDFKGHWLMEQYDLTRDIAPSISFPESHDTKRFCEETKGNIDGLKQRYLFSSLFSAGVMMPVGFEFGFRKKLHVVKTRPEDWEQTNIDLTAFITKVNQIKAQRSIFQEEAPTAVLQHNNPNVLVLWKASTNTPEESLLILNKDARQRQPFSVESLQEYVQAGAPLSDLSPEDPLTFIPKPFSYELRPGQGLVLITSRDRAQED